MEWIKKGLIYDPSQHSGWVGRHAQGPTVLVGKDYLRIYFAGRPEPNISLPTFIDVALDNPQKILFVNSVPLLELGKRGSFDEFGIIPCEVVNYKGKILLYYTGWSRGVTVTYILSIGLAISHDGGMTFEKAYEGPILDRTKHEPYMTMSPFIYKDGKRWHMWYASGTGFHELEGKYEPQYIIKYAYSNNGIDWHQLNQTCIEPNDPLESNTRPTVVKKDGKFHMWFAYRGANDYRGGKNSYRIGYAQSIDFIHWIRNDNLAGITVSEQGWDSNIITYPYVVKVGGKLLMFYNGNGFGASGFGYAAASLEDNDANS
jgi:predicted GH43/DUF377 family glycosyl hydrolase